MSARESCPLLKCVSPVGCRVFGCYELLKMAEAARPSRDAELAALKAENASLRAERDAAVAEGAVIGRMNAMKDAEAEIGRLREALEHIAEVAQRQAGHDIRQIARAALEPKP